MTLNLLDSWTIGDEGVRQIIPQLVGLKTVTVAGVKSAGDTLNQSSRLALAVLGQFQIENALRNVARELGAPSTTTGFYRTAASVIQSIGLPADRLAVLNTAARIRNSLHSNGIHRRGHPNEPTTVVVRGVTYDFIDGQKVSCAGWEHIAHALEASVGVLSEVFRHPRVLAVPDPMLDEYAWEMHTDPTRVV